MKRVWIAILIGCLLAPAATAQWQGAAGGCATGRCPANIGPPAAIAAAPGATSATIPANSRAAIVRIVNARGPMRALGTGTLVDVDGPRGLVITCAHLFREGTGTILVAYPGGGSYEARLLKIDAAVDLAALATTTNSVEPIPIADEYPQRGDPLVSCGYGADGRLWCNRGKALGYVATSTSPGRETLELSGAARFGDSGGPVFNREYELAGVLFGTNGRVVDATFCGRVRRFLRGLSPRFRGEEPAAPRQPSPQGDASDSSAPLVDVPPPRPPAQTPPAGRQSERDRFATLEGLVARLHDRWQSVNSKVDRLADLVRNMPAALAGKGDASRRAPAGADPLDAIAERARPALSARLTAILVSVGVPGGIAGLVAGAAVYVAMRRGKRRLQARLDRLRANAGQPTDDPRDAADQSIVRHYNRYVPYEVTALDRAWARAHAHIGEKYPGAVPYLKMVEGVKDQLLSGKDERTISEGRDS